MLNCMMAWSAVGEKFTAAGNECSETVNIEFSDAKVKAICVANWDTNGDGELSEEEAEDVTSIGTAFQNNTEITSFSESNILLELLLLDNMHYPDVQICLQ